MSSEFAIAVALVLLVATSLLFCYNEILAFFSLMAIRLLAEPLNQYGTGIFNPIGLFGITLILYSLFIILFRRDARVNIPVIKFYCVFVFLSFFSIIHTREYLSFGIYLSKYSAMASLFVISYNLFKDSDEVARGLKYYVLISTPVMLYGFYQLATGGGQHAQVHIGVTYNKLLATFSHPNNYSFYLATVIFSALAVIQLPIRKNKLFYGLLGAAVISLIFTYSRSAWLSVTACCLIWVLMNRKGRVPILILSALVSLAFTPLIVDRFSDVTASMGTGDLEDLESGSSLGFRITLAKILLFDAFPDSPLFGFGLGSSMAVAQKYANWTTPPHNEYLRVLIESGLVGMLGYLAFLFSYLVFLIGNVGHLGTNVYYKGLLLMFVFYCGITFGTNALGGISSGGMWFCALGIMMKGLHLTKRSADQERKTAA